MIEVASREAKGFQGVGALAPTLIRSRFGALAPEELPFHAHGNDSQESQI